MFERPQIGERVILVHVDLLQSNSQEDLVEFKELAISAGTVPVALIKANRDVPDPKYFIGVGKIQEIRTAVEVHQAEVILFNHTLSPSQERNLEQYLKCRVLDRTTLILDIFAQRARTFEGKLQVELAQLHYLSTRLVRGWTHLERQKGGIGLRGPGETQLETDRRLIRGRMKIIRKRLEKVRQQRQQNRRARQRALLPTVSIVGYTNAGKSTLFNRISGAEIYTADKLFATLDPTFRRIELPNAGAAIIADTVGFIRHLPHDLVEAFHATLEEAQDADLLLHIVDLSNPNNQDHMQQVDAVLEEIKALHVPQMIVFNKIDLLPDCNGNVVYDIDHKPKKVWVSAKTGEGFEVLYKAIADHLYGDPIRRTISLSPKDGKLRAQLYAMGAVEREQIDEQGNCSLSICMAKTDFQRIFPNLLPTEDIAE